MKISPILNYNNKKTELPSQNPSFGVNLHIDMDVHKFMQGKASQYGGVLSDMLRMRNSSILSELQEMSKIIQPTQMPVELKLSKAAKAAMEAGRYNVDPFEIEGALSSTVQGQKPFIQEVKSFFPRKEKVLTSLFKHHEYAQDLFYQIGSFVNKISKETK